MDDNPYRSPEAPIMAQAVGVLSGSREDLRSVAKYQRGLLVCVLIYLGAVAASMILPRILPPELTIIASLLFAVAGIAGLVFVFLLSTKVYGTGLGVLFGLLTLIPCVGLIVLLVINQKATSVLRQNGVKVGLLGADPNAI
jgi:hypothetical protein